MRPNIRQARAGDLPLLAAIEISAGNLFAGTAMAHVIGAPPSPPDALAAALMAGAIWVASDGNDAPNGFLFGKAVDGWFHILEVSVHADAQRQGHGAALLAAAVAAAPGLGCQRASLTTDRWIAWNAPFYARHGFVELAATDLPDWLAGILSREAASGLDPARRCAMVRTIE